MRLLLLLGLVNLACAASWKNMPHDRIYQRTPPPKLHPRPLRHRPTDIWYGFMHTTARPLGYIV